ncbi:ATP-binding protein [Aeromonas enteropelogenes]|uniref:ATP-binding protein n=1 Tax=Aeromonas enteropelogenes TaxID=29489 RepID=UPI0031365B0A
MQEQESNLFKSQELDIIQRLKETNTLLNPVETKLETDEKVLARVTDGIYRYPGSAIRELISNAYDADAENVYISTDVPRFDTMTIRDDGNGMSVETLVNLLGHIGGSAKRSTKGSILNVTDSNDSSLSKVKKRKLIGKIGIGLFSVAQLTREFEIITKQEGTDFYLKARIKLHNYSEEYIRSIEREFSSDKDNERGATFETGHVKIWKELTENINAHGTDIILKNIKKSARDQLRSVDIWGQESAETEQDTTDDSIDGFLNSSKLIPPKFHVGNYSGADGLEYYDSSTREPNLPWIDDTPSNEKLNKLYQGLLGLTATTTNPKVSVHCDSYLQMIWGLSLSVPLNYIDKHPFSYAKEDVEDIFIISNKLKGQVNDLSPEAHSSPIKSTIPLRDKYNDIDFNVVIDGLTLYRPIKFTDLPKSGGVVNKPILFIGSYAPNLSSSDIRDSGGRLAFDAYILWTPKVIPKEHNGVLVRINNASGIMFDETFMKHQVAEHTIKSQLTIEIFVHEGLDSALNIDRESFNIAHPHYQIVMRWLHQAIRQVVNKYKAIKKESLLDRKKEDHERLGSVLNSIVTSRAKKIGRDIDTLSHLCLVKSINERTESQYSTDGINNELPELAIESIAIDKSKFLELSSLSKSSQQKQFLLERKVDAIIKILDSYNLFENLKSEQRAGLIEDIIQIISFEG